MTIEEFKSIKKGDLIHYVNNGGVGGISIYQYLGIFTDHTNKETKHLFISGYFLSTVCILVGREENSLTLKEIFLTCQ